MSITCQQDNCIFYIEEILKVKFEGSNKDEAQKFIDDNLERAFEVVEFKTMRLKSNLTKR